MLTGGPSGAVQQLLFEGGEETFGVQRTPPALLEPQRAKLVRALWAGNPWIAVSEVCADAIDLNPQTIEPGEEEIVLAALPRHVPLARARTTPATERPIASPATWSERTWMPPIIRASLTSATSAV